MFRRLLCMVVLLMFVAAVSGCFVTQDKYVKKEEEANTLAKTNSEIAAQNERLKAENADLKKQVTQKDDLLQKKSEDIAKQDAKQAEMVNELDRMKAQLSKSREAAIEESPAAKKASGPKALRIKVLSGDGKADSARKMARRITSMGYKVESVGMAQSADYPAITVYFAPKYKAEAKTLAAKLGKETIAKPLSWKSVFNLIVVTGG